MTIRELIKELIDTEMPLISEVEIISQRNTIGIYKLSYNRETGKVYILTE